MSEEHVVVGNKAEVVQAWAEKNADLVNVEVIESFGLGLAAKSDAEEGDLLCQVPKQLVISEQLSSSLSDKDSRYHKWLNGSLMGSSGPHLLQRLVLYLALSQDQYPLWRPYFRTLPNAIELSLPFSWSLDRVDELEFLSIHEATVFKRKFVDAVYKAASEAVAETFKEVSLHTWILTFEWIASRCLSTPAGEAILVPVIDLVNHSEHANARYDFVDGDVILVATRPIKSGEQVYIDYGPRSSGEFLFKYGFVPSEPDQVLVRDYDPMDERIRRVLDPSRDPDVPDTETKELLEGAYSILTQFCQQPVLRLDLSGDKVIWDDAFITFLACEDLLELKCQDGNYDLYFANRPVNPQNVRDLQLHPDVAERAATLVGALCKLFAEGASQAAKSADVAEIRALATHEKELLERVSSKLI